MSKGKDFKWKYFEPSIILWGVRWCCRYAISYCDVNEVSGMINLDFDKNKSYPPVFDELEEEDVLPKTCRFRQKKYLNSIIEQPHRFIKRLIKNNQWFQSFKTARRIITRFEIMNMIRQGQVKFIAKGDVFVQKTFVESLFGIGV